MRAHGEPEQHLRHAAAPLSERSAADMTLPITPPFAGLVWGINRSGLLADRPAPYQAGTTYAAIDNGNLYRDNGSSWDLVNRGEPWPGSPGDSSQWTAINQGTATFVHDRDNIVMTAPASASTSNVRAYVRTAPAVPYTLTVRFDLITAPVANYWEQGIVLRNSSSGALVTFTLRYGDGPKVNVAKYNSPTSYNSAYATPAVTVFPNWLRIRDNGTTRFFEYSTNGLDWTLVTSHARTDFTTPDQYGLAVPRQDVGSRRVGLM